MGSKLISCCVSRRTRGQVDLRHRDSGLRGFWPSHVLSHRTRPSRRGHRLESLRSRELEIDQLMHRVEDDVTRGGLAVELNGPHYSVPKQFLSIAALFAVRRIG